MTLRTAERLYSGTALTTPRRCLQRGADSLSPKKLLFFGGALVAVTPPRLQKGVQSGVGGDGRRKEGLRPHPSRRALLL